jgi:hypothetical protein
VTSLYEINKQLEVLARAEQRGFDRCRDLWFITADLVQQLGGRAAVQRLRWDRAGEPNLYIRQYDIEHPFSDRIVLANDPKQVREPLELADVDWMALLLATIRDEWNTPEQWALHAPRFPGISKSLREQLPAAVERLRERGLP